MVLQKLWQKRRKSHRSRHAKIIGDGGCKVAKRGAGAKILVCPHPSAAAKQRNVLTAVVGGGGGRVTAVVGGDKQQVFLPEQRQQPSQMNIKAVERLSIAFRVVAVTIEHIKFDQIDKTKPREIGPAQLEGALHSLVVGVGKDLLGDAFSGKDVGDLADYQDARVNKNQDDQEYYDHRGRSMLIQNSLFTGGSFTIQDADTYNQQLTTDYANRTSAAPVRCIRYDAEP